jgi:Protein of unknown function (DUF3224)
MELHMFAKHRCHATGRTTVKTYEPKLFDEVPGGLSVTDIHVTETFSGDVEGDGDVHVLQAARPDGSASFVGIERVRGGIGGKKGSFLLQVRGASIGREMAAEWFVLPGSGTEELRGLRGDGGFRAELGQYGTIWLDYYFEANP